MTASFFSRKEVMVEVGGRPFGLFYLHAQNPALGE
jgi:hypothetical protein